MTYTCVRHFLRNRAGNSLTYCVRNPFVLYFTLISSAAYFSGYRLGTPDPSANSGSGALNFHCFAATGFVDRAARAAIIFPGSRLTNTLLDNWSGTMLGSCFPFATADFNVVPGMNGLTNSTTYITVTGFVIRFVNRAANISIMSFTNRTSYRIANISVASVINRLADRVADIPVAGVIHGAATFACHSPIAGFVNGTAYFIADVTIAGLINRLANRIAFITVASLVNILRILNGNFFADRIIHCFLTGIVLLFPYSFNNSLIAGT